MTRHPVDLLSFAAGLLTLALGLVLLSGGFGGLRLEWAGPAVVIGLGVLIALGARASRAGRDAGEPDPTHEA